MIVHLLFIIFLNIIINKLYMSQTSDNNKRNNEEYVASIFPNAAFDGCIVVYGAMYIARILNYSGYHYCPVKVD